jgi:hypothetical protein
MGNFLSYPPHSPNTLEDTNQNLIPNPLEDTSQQIICVPDHRLAQAHKRPVYESKCIFQSHQQFLTWMNVFKDRGILCSIAKSETRDGTYADTFPYSRIHYFCQCCKNKMAFGLQVKYHYSRKLQQI